MRREDELLRELKRIEEDERLWYGTATTFKNALLVLIQLEIETKSNMLRWVLLLPFRPTKKEELSKSYERV